MKIKRCPNTFSFDIPPVLLLAKIEIHWLAFSFLFKIKKKSRHHIIHCQPMSNRLPISLPTDQNMALRCVQMNGLILYRNISPESL
jgi:hypothetical protein